MTFLFEEIINFLKALFEMGAAENVWLQNNLDTIVGVMALCIVVLCFIFWIWALITIIKLIFNFRGRL